MDTDNPNPAKSASAASPGDNQHQLGGTLTFRSGRFKGAVATLDDRGIWHHADEMTAALLNANYPLSDFRHPASIPPHGRALAAAAENLDAEAHCFRQFENDPDVQY